MEKGVQAIISQIDFDAVRHSEERISQMKAAIDREIERENTLFKKELEQRREVLITNSKHDLRHRLERHSRRLNRMLLTYRRELLDEIFDMAVRELSDISEDEYANIFTAATSQLSGNFTLYIGEFSRDKLNSMTVEPAIRLNNDLNIEISSDLIPKKSGFVIKDDRVEYNYLFEDLIDDKKTEQAALILKEVFEDG